MQPEEAETTAVPHRIKALIKGFNLCTGQSNDRTLLLLRVCVCVGDYIRTVEDRKTERDRELKWLMVGLPVALIESRLISLCCRRQTVIILHLKEIQDDNIHA